MDDLLNDVAEKVANQMDRASVLHDVIQLIPSPGEELSFILESDDVEVKEFANKLQRLSQLELKESINDKTRDLLGDVVVEISTLMASSPKLRSLLEQHSQHTATRSSGVDDINISARLKQYLDKVSDVGCRNISTSDLVDKKNTSVLFKLIEKCKRLEADSVTIKEGLHEREMNLDRERNESRSTLESTAKLCEEIKLKATRDHDVNEVGIGTELENWKAEHEAAMSVLQSELSTMQDRLNGETQSHYLEQQGIMDQLKEMTTNREIMKEKLMLQKSRRQETLSSIDNHLNAEKIERGDLKQQCALIESNKNVTETEDRNLQQVLSMENQAHAILFHSAVALQKLCRGTSARNIVRKMKQKKGKGKKGKGKTSKQKKVLK